MGAWTGRMVLDVKMRVKPLLSPKFMQINFSTFGWEMEIIIHECKSEENICAGLLEFISR